MLEIIYENIDQSTSMIEDTVADLILWEGV